MKILKKGKHIMHPAKMVVMLEQKVLSSHKE
jgi:hypothetical protein